MTEKNKYAIVLGCSSGFGKATTQKLAENGYNIYGVHFDRGGNLKQALDFRDSLEAMGVKAKFYNVNAASDEKRAEVVAEIKSAKDDDPSHHLRVLIHSLAFGSLKSFIDQKPSEMMSRKQVEMTMDVMANSLVYWTQDLHNAGVLEQNSRLIGFSSIGASRQMHKYGAVSAAKAALESYLRQLAIEMAPFGTTANSIFAGLTQTAAASKIPGYDKMVRYGIMQNPFNRLTRAEDVAKVVNMLVDENNDWITGETIRVDGGDAIYEYYEYDKE